MVSSDVTLYDKQTITNMYLELRRFHGQLAQAGGDDLETASKNLMAAWSDGNGNVNAAYEHGFLPVKKDWDGEFADTLRILEDIATALENAMGAAFGADARIADGFGAV
ncbi:hypothetical protein IU474_01500 [Nocardia otitidiscaviarum]|uniref:hypothetical protein n=1 Tax=Nocardia otitidiscaviarum TaxID=1823 RepID=UPI001895EB32|nr:hypothetical protein [Nocardia otitidiscaviarum]MBF6235756.1 hypothetical protein [Nocardia otitidiscaviarum]